jgi:hypothetical protein
VQYHEALATDQEKLREALDKMEAWVRKLKEEEKERADASPACPEELEGPGVSEAGILPADAEPSAEIEAGPSAELRAGKMPAPPEEKPASRPPAPYSAGGASLDWTKL